MNNKTLALAKTFGVHPDDLKHFPAGQLENQKSLYEIFIGVSDARRLLCLLAAWKDSGASVSGMFRSEYDDLYRFSRVDPYIDACSAALFSGSGGLILLDENEIISVKPVSFSFDTMVFELYTQFPLLPKGGLAAVHKPQILYLYIWFDESDTDLPQTVPVFAGLFLRFKTADDFDSFAAFVSEALQLQNIFRRDYLAVVAPDESYDTGTLSTPAASGAYVYSDMIAFTFENREHPLLILRRKAFECIEDRNNMGNSAYMFTVRTVHGCIEFIFPVLPKEPFTQDEEDDTASCMDE